MDRKSKFIAILALEIPAIIISCIIFIHFIFDRQARSKLKNHGWIVLLIVNFSQLTIDLPMPMSYYYLNTAWPASDAYCTWWLWFEFSVNTIGLFLMAWISLQRHIIVFHPHVLTQVLWKKWLFHYLPIIFCLIWTPIFYLFVIVISPMCSNVWDYSLLNCGYPCYYTTNNLGQVDFLLNLIFPITLIMLANVTLMIRVIYRKISRRRGINWRRHRKMALQLWIVSSLYMAFWLPMTITQLIQVTVMPLFMMDQLEMILFVVYFIPLLLPIICLSTQPDLIKKIVNFITKPRLNTVGTVAFTQRAKQTAATITFR